MEVSSGELRRGIAILSRCVNTCLTEELLQWPKQISVHVKIVMSHLRPINEGHWLSCCGIGQLLPMMEWNDIVLSPMQDESRTGRFSNFNYVFEAFSDENTQRAYLVLSHSLNTCVR